MRRRRNFHVLTGLLILVPVDRATLVRRRRNFLLPLALPSCVAAVRSAERILFAAMMEAGAGWQAVARDAPMGLFPRAAAESP